MSSHRRLSILFLVLALPSTLAQCYYPNGEVAEGDTPCDEDAENSMCCGSSAGSVCLSNKLCSGPNGNVIRGSCTDEDWNAPECANYCLGASTGGTDLISCLNVTESDTLYCCDHTVDCCDTGVGRFRVLPSNPEVWARFNNREEKFNVVGDVFTSIPITTESETTTSTSREQATTTTRDDSATETSSKNQDDDARENNNDLSVGAMAGIGVGAGLGLLILLALAAFVWRRRRNRLRREAEVGLHQSRGELSGDKGNGNGSEWENRSAREGINKPYDGVQEAPGVVPPRHYHQHVQELPASPIPTRRSNSR